MFDAIDLDAYLQRIGYRGAPKPDQTTLRALAVAHAAALPFENLDPLCGVPVQLELDALERKLLHQGRGGYCFEQNLLFAAALRMIGFTVQGLIARVLWNQPEDAVTAQTHMLLRVEADGESWLTDVGFGSMNLAGALRLEPDVAQVTGLEPFRLLERNGEWRMQACVRGDWLTLYRFDLEPRASVDYVVANHYVSTYPSSNFVQHLIAARTTQDRRLTLRDREFTVRRPGMEPERHTLPGSEDICRVLEQEFLLRLPDRTRLLQKLDALPQ
ncbi:arylamine N-acetyltransferase [Rhodanobacter sp. 7MK24]|uniref:arylamine N-acetyltransferase family protein n=1 Tax=Rhodanobacter sp. 7MK24 TaxID=2775922 RepID=UPI00177EFC4D|nr:arylamine N-acetyltransferase [Rhodanobacter sp. 7MK24]MBD8879586.1 arylamine N-acetyltransferase [Rhodanobacter sp. 7MK24]